MRDAVLLIIGAVLGVVASELWASSRRLSGDMRQRSAAKKRQEREAHQRHAIVQRFTAAAIPLYQTATFSETITIPFLHETSLPIRGQVPPESDRFLTVTHPQRTEFDIDHAAIRRLLRAGANLWDGYVLYLRRPPDRGAQDTVLDAGVCNYFAYVTEKEHAMRRTGKSRQPLPLWLHNMDAVLASGPVPLTLAASIVCVFDGPNGTEVALQRRSNQVISAMGSVGVIPLCGLEPNSNGTDRSRFGVLTYNFLKEFLEEFFDEEELIKAATSSRIHPDWIFSLPAAARLIGELEAGRLTLEVLGLGYDVRDNSLTFAMCARFTDRGYLQRLKLECTPGWESQEGDLGEGPVRFLAFDDPEIDRLVLADEMDGSSTFALDLARHAARRP